MKMKVPSKHFVRTRKSFQERKSIFDNFFRPLNGSEKTKILLLERAESGFRRGGISPVQTYPQGSEDFKLELPENRILGLKGQSNQSHGGTHTPK